MPEKSMENTKNDFMLQLNGSQKKKRFKAEEHKFLQYSDWVDIKPFVMFFSVRKLYTKKQFF